MGGRRGEGTDRVGVRDVEIVNELAVDGVDQSGCASRGRRVGREGEAERRRGGRGHGEQAVRVGDGAAGEESKGPCEHALAGKRARADQEQDELLLPRRRVEAGRAFSLIASLATHHGHARPHCRYAPCSLVYPPHPSSPSSPPSPRAASSSRWIASTSTSSCRACSTPAAPRAAAAAQAPWSTRAFSHATQPRRAPPASSTSSLPPPLPHHAHRNALDPQPLPTASSSP